MWAREFSVQSKGTRESEQHFNSTSLAVVERQEWRQAGAAAVNTAEKGGIKRHLGGRAIGLDG